MRRLGSPVSYGSRQSPCQAPLPFSFSQQRGNQLKWENQPQEGPCRREGVKVHVALVGASCPVKGGYSGASSAEPTGVLETV